LTGRENTYLSGAILGMDKREIARKFDEIVAFAELEKFIDTPVKHYSSGMYVRLAFAVAAHLEPEILLVDEVLAVGDINFQKKCLGKMGGVARAGRTVVLVSHQLNQIRRLCTRVIWVDNGQVKMVGGAHEVVSAYELAMSAKTSHFREQSERLTGKARFVCWEISEPETSAHTLGTFGRVKISFNLEAQRSISQAVHGIALYNTDRQLVWGTATTNLEIHPGLQQFSYEFPMLPLRPGPYSWLLSLFDDEGEVDMWDAVPELIVATESHQHYQDQWTGALNLPVEFTQADLWKSSGIADTIPSERN
jgi:lipopolysaccharide transport system ATP-binding protein